MWKDDTREIPLNKYIEVQNRFFHHFSTLPGVLGYGTFGSIKAPGLSDLDLIVVVEDESLSRKNFHLPTLRGDEKYIFTHTPLIVPYSLLKYLPYYHLVDIDWAEGEFGYQEVSPKDFRTIGALNVIDKTIYLQSFLWNILFQNCRPCKRSIIALTSVARSIEWMQRLSINVRDSDIKYVVSILNLRNDWLSSPNNRENQTKILDLLLIDAIKITIELPEIIASEMLSLESDKTEARKTTRCLQRSPMNFIFESSQNSEDIINNIQKNKTIKNLVDFFGKLSVFTVGKFAFSGPLAFSILDLDFSLTIKYRKSICGYRWGPNTRENIQKIAQLVFSETIQKKFAINSKFAKILADAGLNDSNFGNVWIPHGINGFIMKSLAKTIGRTRIIHHLITKQD